MNPLQEYPKGADWYTLTTFRALVEAIVPDTPHLAGAAAWCVHEYMIWELDHNLALYLGYYLAEVPLASSTAMLLNAGAAQFIASDKTQNCWPYAAAGARTPFALLSPQERIRVLAMLEQLDVDLGSLPPPYKDDGGLVKFIVDYLNRGTMFGAYSEWSAYGTTRLRTPTQRVLEYFPAGWRQAEYPGVSKGYRALRGYLLTIERTGRESTNA